jgi:hypothetical protein
MGLGTQQGSKLIGTGAVGPQSTEQGSYVALFADGNNGRAWRQLEHRGGVVLYPQQRIGKSGTITISTLTKALAENFKYQQMIPPILPLMFLIL